MALPLMVPSPAFAIEGLFRSGWRLAAHILARQGCFDWECPWHLDNNKNRTIDIACKTIKEASFRVFVYSSTYIKVKWLPVEFN